MSSNVPTVLLPKPEQFSLIYFTPEFCTSFFLKPQSAKTRLMMISSTFMAYFGERGFVDILTIILEVRDLFV